MSTRGAVLQALKDCKYMRDHGCIPSNSGICGYVEDRTGFDGFTVGDILKPIFRKWPRYSGTSWYPVPHPDYEEGSYIRDPKYWAEQAFEEDYEYERWTGPYGELRDELLSFCIEQLEKEMRK